MSKHVEILERMPIPSSNKQHLFILAIGDIGGSGGDGHCIEKKFLVQSSHPLQEVVTAYLASASKYNLPLSNHCSDYEEFDLPDEFIDNYKTVFNMSEYEMEALLDRNFFPEMYLNISKLSLLDAEFVFIAPKSVYIGGYGLV